jgi:hypothetical protein
MWMIIDNAERRIVENDFETREEADARLAELIKDDPRAEGVLRVVSYGELPSHEIRLTGSVVLLPHDRWQELLERLESGGEAQAAEGIRMRGVIPEDRKPAVLDLLNRWLDEAKLGTFGEHLQRLRHELHRDLHGDTPASG